MRKGKELQGLAVVDIAGGTKLGTLDELVISPADGTVLAIVLKGGMTDRGSAYIPADRVRAFGTDAVTVENADVARSEDDVDQATRDAHAARQTIVGNKVVTEGGTLLGTVSDYYIDEAARRVTGLTIGGGLLSSEDAVAADRVVSVGADAIIVRDEGAASESGPREEAGWAS